MQGEYIVAKYRCRNHGVWLVTRKCLQCELEGLSHNVIDGRGKIVSLAKRRTMSEEVRRLLLRVGPMTAEDIAERLVKKFPDHTRHGIGTGVRAILGVPNPRPGFERIERIGRVLWRAV